MMPGQPGRVKLRLTPREAGAQEGDGADRAIVVRNLLWYKFRGPIPHDLSIWV